MNQISKDFYCSAGFNREHKKHELGYCAALKGGCGKLCPAFHRKYSTPEQFKEKYGQEVPDNMPVWSICDGSEKTWRLSVYWEIKDLCFGGKFTKMKIVCACTPYGKPDDKWRPE